MEMRTLGTSGPAVSLVGLGCNNFAGRIDFAASEAVVHTALELGITFFDTADTYGHRGGAPGGSEEFLGRILGARRKEIVLATKFGMAMGSIQGGASRNYILSEVEASLKRLRTDWIDLYQLHRPDPRTPVEETLGALDQLVRQGKVRFIGCSYLTGAQLDEARGISAREKLAAYITCQNEYSLLERGIEKDLVPAMAKYGNGLLPYLPLAGGMLTGKYRRGAPPPAGSRFSYTRWQADQFMTASRWRVVEALEQFAAARGKSLLELAMGWLAAHQNIPSIIAGATKPEQVAANVAAVNWRPNAEEMAALDRITL